jgi:aminoglycoside/choline kinase family phosphotransferase
MVKGDRLWMVDFQDARMGPYTYDLASLVRDSYVRLPEDLVEEMIRFHREAASFTEPEETYRYNLARTSLQRNIKAIGTFASQAMLRGNRGYLRYIPCTLDSVRARLGETRDDPSADEIRALFEGPLAFAGEAASA